MRAMGLRTRLLLGVVGLVVFFGLAVISLVQTVLAQKLHLELHKRGLSIAREIGRQSADPILTENTVDLRLLVNDVMGSEDDIEYVFILSPQGVVLAHTFEDGFPTELREANELSVGETHRTQLLAGDEGTILDVAVPVLEGGVGVARVGLSEQSVREAVADIVHPIIWMIIAVSAIGGAAAVYLAVTLTRPVLELAEVARAVGGGSLERRARVTTGDEVGELGRALNSMLEELRGATALLEEKNRLLTASHELGELILSPLDLDQVLDNLAEQIVAGGIFRSVMIALVDEQGQYVEVVRSIVLPRGDRAAEMAEAASRSQLRYELTDDNITAVVARTGQMHVIEGDDDRFDRKVDKPGARPGEVAYFIPVMQEGRVVAVLATGSQVEEREDMLHRIEVMKPLLNQVAIALEHARLFRELQKEIVERQEAERVRQQLEHGLILSERMASVGTVAAGIVHNLRGPLTSVLGYGRLVQREHPDLHGVEQITAAAQRMSEMIEDILAKSRQRKDPEPTDLATLLQRELDFLQADQVYKHGVEKHIRLGEGLPTVNCVYTDLSQVFGNLLRNAVDAMHQRETKKLTVVASADTKHVTVEVTDTGCGIPEENIPHLFEPFFTTKPPEAKNGEPIGTGLGLYTVRQLLEPYAAELEVESTVDVGTTFRVRIPI